MVMRQRGRSTLLKSPDEIEKMRRAGAVVHQVLQRMREMAVPGVSTAEMNAVAEEMILQAGAVPLFKGVKSRQARMPFPTVLCTSVNEQVVHGIPSDRRLVEGDVVSVDCGVRLEGFCGDSAATFAIGAVADRIARLLQVTQESLQLAIREIRPKRWWSEVARQMQAHVEAAGFSVVREFVGHGIGREMHEEPKIPNYFDPRERRMDFLMTAGMTLAIEPMVNAGGPDVDYGDSTGWPVITRDRQYAAHFEHTVAVTERGADVLTDGRKK